MNKIGTYLQNQVMTASPAELTLLLFDEGVRSLKKAQAGFTIETPERFEIINNHLVHAQDVIMELSMSLDLAKGGEVAANLQRIISIIIVNRFCRELLLLIIRHLHNIIKSERLCNQ